MGTVEFSRRRLIKGVFVFVSGALITALKYSKHNVTESSGGYLVGRHVLSHAEGKNCSVPGITKFPHNLFTQEQRDNGAIVIHILASIYLCGAIAYICDVYFIPSIEVICRTFNIRSDVAGASFMAAGSSAPEFFTSMIGTFVVEDDIGVDAIVGSAAFNVFFILGVCPFVCDKPIKLTWYPILRDSICWTISIIFFIVTVYDSLITWYESTILSILYTLYLVLMYFNGYFAKHAVRLIERMDDRKNEPELDVNETTFIVEIVHQENYGADYELFPTEDETEENKSIFSAPGSPARYVCWIIGLPIIALSFLTIPDCRKKSCEKYFFITFCMGIIWMAGLSFILVWMITVIGYTIHFPDSMMGFTFLAIGTSLPDLFACVLVVKEGFGDMAIANIIGSNVFEILICLGFLWFVKISSSENWDPIIIGSPSLIMISTGLIGTVIFILVSLHIREWILDRKLGVLAFCTYFIFMLFIVLHEQGFLDTKSKIDIPLCLVE